MVCNIDQIMSNLELMHPSADCELKFSNNFELLIAVILSAQCTDKRVNLVTPNLFRDYGKPEILCKATPLELKPYIFSCGFYNNKAKNLISMAQELVDRFSSEVPNDFDSLASLSGVGRKTASVVLAVGFNIAAMPVDTHVFRVARRIGLSLSNNVIGVERDLKKVLPEERWNKLHHTLIFHGRYLCKAAKPQCAACKLTQYCQYYLSMPIGVKNEQNT